MSWGGGGVGGGEREEGRVGGLNLGGWRNLSPIHPMGGWGEEKTENPTTPPKIPPF